MKSKTKNIKYLIVAIVAIIVVILLFFIYKTLFSSGLSNRLEDSSNYKLTKDEIKKVKNVFNDNIAIDSIDVYTNYKIIKIFIILKDDVAFDKIKTLSNETLEIFSEENLSYYDVEIFIESKNSDSDIYPKIGYKHKKQSEFVW